MKMQGFATKPRGRTQLLTQAERMSQSSLAVPRAGLGFGGGRISWSARASKFGGRINTIPKFRGYPCLTLVPLQGISNSVKLNHWFLQLLIIIVGILSVEVAKLLAAGCLIDSIDSLRTGRGLLLYLHLIVLIPRGPKNNQQHVTMWLQRQGWTI